MIKLTQKIITSILRVLTATILMLLFLRFKTVYANLLHPQKGHGVIIPSMYYQSMNSIYENTLTKNRKILQATFNLYGEYTVTNRLTLGAKAIATVSMSTNKHGTGRIKDRTYALNSAEFFSALAIIRNHDIFSLYIATQVGIPTIYDKKQINYFGVDKWSYETRLEFGVKFSKKNFFILTAGWHGYVQNSYNEIRVEMTYGQYIIPEILFMLKLQKFFYIKKNDPLSNKAISIDHFNAQDGFGKITASIISPINRNMSLEAGFFSSIKSKILLTKNSNITLRGCYIGLLYRF